MSQDIDAGDKISVGGVPHNRSAFESEQPLKKMNLLSEGNEHQAKSFQAVRDSESNHRSVISSFSLGSAFGNYSFHKSQNKAAVKGSDDDKLYDEKMDRRGRSRGANALSLPPQLQLAMAQPQMGN